MNDLYNSNEISLLLQKLVCYQDAFIAKKKERRRKLRASMIEVERDCQGENQAERSIREHNKFEVGEEADVELDAVREGTATAQDLLSVIKSAALAEALPQAMILLKLAVTTPLTSIHCERVHCEVFIAK